MLRWSGCGCPACDEPVGLRLEEALMAMLLVFLAEDVLNFCFEAPVTLRPCAWWLFN